MKDERRYHLTHIDTIGAFVVDCPCESDVYNSRCRFYVKLFTNKGCVLLTTERAK